MLVSTSNYAIALDSAGAADLHFVSHAHTDHTRGIHNNSTVLASEITKEFLEAKGKRNISVANIPMGIKLLNAGHILGSRQILIEDYERGYSIAYTGDYQVEEPLLAENIEIRKADALIMDSTYPYEDLVFDPKQEVITSIQHYAMHKLDKGSILFSAYSLGRAQELISIYNEIGITPLVDPDTARISEVYKKHGISLCFDIYNSTDLPRDNFVGIFAGRRFGEVASLLSSSSRRIFTAVATGWAKLMRFNTNVQFALTDHATFDQALHYIELASPKLIFTTGANATALAERLKMKGYAAKMLDADTTGQRMLPIANFALQKTQIKTSPDKI
ncbi:MAG: hypothetical protein QXR85_01560 [Candidatus Micrarchaeaceae archaeon]